LQPIEVANDSDIIFSYNRWDTKNSLGGAMAIVAHTAYHLGEIQQAT